VDFNLLVTNVQRVVQ